MIHRTEYDKFVKDTGIVNGDWFIHNMGLLAENDCRYKELYNELLRKKSVNLKIASGLRFEEFLDEADFCYGCMSGIALDPICNGLSFYYNKSFDKNSSQEDMEKYIYDIYCNAGSLDKFNDTIRDIMNNYTKWIINNRQLNCGNNAMDSVIPDVPYLPDFIINA